MASLQGEMTSQAPPSGADNYVLGAEIARGGMGYILEAEDTKLRRTVAAKLMIHDADTDEGMKQRFLREAEVLALLAHPNIVPIHDIIWEQGMPLFYTMKRVNGRTLQAILRDLREADPAALRDFTLDRLLLIFRKVCDALAFAHSKGVIHRDLKPDNIMIGEFGEVLVMDWGIAKQIGDLRLPMVESLPRNDDASPESGNEDRQSPMRTIQGAVLGTPQYMAPEQARGEIDQLDERSDIFSLGGILYAILTLRPPVEGSSLYEILKKVTKAEITAPTALTSTSSRGQTMEKSEVLEAKLIKPLAHVPAGRVPTALSSVVMKSLRLEKAQRYQSVAEFSADIEAYQSGFATKAEDASLSQQLVLLIKRHRGIFSTAAAALMLIAVLAVWFIINLQAKERRALAGEQTALVEKEAARRSAARASLSLAEASLREGNGTAMQAVLNDVPTDLRDSTWRYLLAQSDRSVARIRTGGEAIEGLAADLTRRGVFALVDQNGKVTIMRVRTGERLLEFRAGFARAEGGTRYRVAFSPDGQHIAVSRGGPGGLVLHRAGDGTKEKEWATPATDRIEFGRNDALLRQGSGSLQIWNPHTGQLWWEDKTPGVIGVRGTFTPDGNSVVMFKAKDRLQLVKADDGSLIRQIGGRTAGYDWTMAVRPDGKAVATLDDARVTECVSLEDGRKLFTLPDKKQRFSLGFSQDGSMLFTVALSSEGVQSIEVWNAQTGELLRVLLGGHGQITSIGLHPVSHELVVAGADSRVWDTTGPDASWRLSSPSAGNIAFWGPEDWVFGYEDNPSEWGLHRLQNDGLERLWQFESPTGGIAASSADGSLAVVARPGWSTDVTLLRKTGPKVQPFKTFSASLWPYRIRPSPGGNRVALMERARTLKFQVFDTTGNESVILDLTKVQRISDLGWLGEERLVGLVTSQAARGNPGSEERVVVWDAGAGKVLQTATHPSALDALCIAPDGRRFAEAGADKIVRIRDGTTLAVQQQFRAHDAPITVLAWHPTEPIVATGSQDLSIKVWNLETERLLTEYHDLLSPPDVLMFSPTGRLLVARTYPDLVGRIWEWNETSPEKASVAPAALPVFRPQAGEWSDLLADLTTAYVKQNGAVWLKRNGKLYSGRGDGPAILPLVGGMAGQSYQLRLQLQKILQNRIQHVLSVALPVGERVVGFELDGVNGSDFFTGLNHVDRKRGPDLPGVIRGRQIVDENPHELVIGVEVKGGTAAIKSTLDGKPLYSWEGPVALLDAEPHWRHAGGTLVLGSLSANWIISEVKVKPLER